MQLTRREKHVLFIAALILLIMIIIRPSQAAVLQVELFYLFLVVLPLGFYLALDPERRRGS